MYVNGLCSEIHVTLRVNKRRLEKVSEWEKEGKNIEQQFEKGNYISA